MCKIFGYRQLSPHGSGLPPVVVVPYENNFLLIAHIWFIRSGSDQIVHTVRLDRFAVFIASLFNFLHVCFLQDVQLWQKRLGQQRIQGLSILTLFRFENHRGVILCLYGIDVAQHILPGGGFIFCMKGEGIRHILRSYRCSV